MHLAYVCVSIQTHTGMCIRVSVCVSVQSHTGTRTHPCVPAVPHQSVCPFHTGTGASARPSLCPCVCPCIRISVCVSFSPPCICVSVRVSVLVAAYPYSALLGLRPAGGAARRPPRPRSRHGGRSCPLSSERPVDRGRRRRGAQGSAGGAAAQGLRWCSGSAVGGSDPAVPRGGAGRGGTERGGEGRSGAGALTGPVPSR